MFRFLFFITGVIVIGAALLWLMGRVWRLLAAPLRFLAILLVLAMAAGGIGLITSGDGEMAMAGGVLLLGVAAYWLTKLTSRKSPPNPAGVSVPPTASRFGTDEWSPLVASLGWRQRSRAADARGSIKRYLVEARQRGLVGHDEGLSIALERRVPELLAEWQRRCAGASAEERQAYGARTLSILEGLAAEADRARAELRSDGDRAFDTLERYFSRFTDRNGRSS